MLSTVRGAANLDREQRCVANLHHGLLPRTQYRECLDDLAAKASGGIHAEQRYAADPRPLFLRQAPDGRDSGARVQCWLQPAGGTGDIVPSSLLSAVSATTKRPPERP